MTPSKALPFGLLHREDDNSERGYGTYPETWNYDPDTQVSDLLMMGETSPTTRSSTASTGMFNSDSDEANDDTGKD